MRGGSKKAQRNMRPMIDRWNTMQCVVSAPVSSGEVQAAWRYSLRDPDVANKFFEALQTLER
jgi:hypothetical protein